MSQPYYPLPGIGERHESHPILSAPCPKLRELNVRHLTMSIIGIKVVRHYQPPMRIWFSVLERDKLFWFHVSPSSLSAF